MSSILNAIRSAPTATRPFTLLNASSASTSKTAFHPEHQTIVLQQLAQSLSPANAAGSASSSAKSAASVARKSLSSSSPPKL
ncbi:hypothetical protein BG011_002265 [Mortierella polycephala]|uniref:Uncharacterized protein n=1 Tax=Mortierella polycephala TaxID=41804 RepID=A0A9P6UAN1_9FUNG|nr:hypothetical protein BG011_002265 [Mortierella polycephala]